MISFFKNEHRRLEQEIIHLKYTMDNMGHKGRKIVTLPSHVFDKVIKANTATQEKGYFVGMLYGVDIYSDKELPVVLTLEDRIKRLEEKLL